MDSSPVLVLLCCKTKGNTIVLTNLALQLQKMNIYNKMFTDIYN